MYNIAICDDELNTCNQLEEYLEKYLRLHYIDGNVGVFYSGETLRKYLEKQGSFDLVFLDIELPCINGIEVGKFLRDTLGDEITDIVYISSKKNYALELFKCRPLDFIIKPLNYQVISNILDVVLKRNQIRRKCFEFENERSVHKVPLQNILYFRSDNKKIYIVLVDGEIEVFNGKLTEVEEKLPELSFLRIHKSYLINFDYVTNYSYEYVTLVNGDVLSISKSNRKTVKTKLLQHECNR